MVRKPSRRQVVIHGSSVGVILLLWYAIHYAFSLFPAPPEILYAYQVQLRERLFGALLQGLQSIFIAFAFSVPTGIGVGLLMGANKYAEYFLDTYVDSLYILPISSIVPAMILWFGTGMQTRVIVIFLFSVLPIIINTSEGIKGGPGIGGRTRPVVRGEPAVHRNEDQTAPRDPVPDHRTAAGDRARRQGISHRRDPDRGHWPRGIITTWGTSVRLEGVTV